MWGVHFHGSLSTGSLIRENKKKPCKCGNHFWIKMMLSTRLTSPSKCSERHSKNSFSSPSGQGLVNSGPNLQLVLSLILNGHFVCPSVTTWLLIYGGKMSYIHQTVDFTHSWFAFAIFCGIIWLFSDRYKNPNYLYEIVLKTDFSYL